jgi:hypothetical protein
MFALVEGENKTPIEGRSPITFTAYLRVMLLTITPYEFTSLCSSLLRQAEPRHERGLDIRHTDLLVLQPLSSGTPFASTSPNLLLLLAYWNTLPYAR